MIQRLVQISLFAVGSTLLLDRLEAFSFIPGWPVSPNKLLTFVLLALAVLYGVVAGWRLPRNRKTGWMIAFFVSLAISSAIALSEGSDPAIMAGRWTKFIAMLSFYFLLCYVVRTRRDLDLFFASLVVSGLIASISAWLLEGSGGLWSPVRKSGLGSNENHAAANILMILPMIYVIAQSRRAQSSKALLFGCSIICVMGFVLTLSRSAFVAAAVMGGLWLFRIRRLRELRLVSIGIVLVVVGVTAAPSGYGDRLRSLFAGFGRSREAYSHDIDYRALTYRAGVSAFAQNPIFGVGVDRFRYWSAKRDPRLGRHVVHNAVLGVAANQGLLGVVPFIALLILTYRDFSIVQRIARRRRALNDSELEALYLRAVTSQVGFVGITVVAMFQPGTFWRGIWALFAVSTVLVHLARARVAELEPERDRKREVDWNPPIGVREISP